jgi:hypothetical protein
MGEVKPFASQKIKPYGTDVSDAVDTKWIGRAAVNAFVVIALASFCSPGLQTLSSSTAGAHHRAQFNHKGKINLCVLAKTPTKVCIRKGGAQNQFRFFILPGTFRRAASTFLRARFARPEFIQALLAEASRFANAPRRFKAASGLSALLSRRLHRLARLRR